jgi:hypothetical protein
MILIPNIKKLMTSDELELYIKYLFEGYRNINSESVKLKMLDDISFIIVNFYYFTGKYNHLKSHELIDLSNPVFEDEDVNDVLGCSGYYNIPNCDIANDFTIAYYMNIRLQIHSDDIYRYIKKYLELDKTGKLFYFIMIEIPKIYRNSVAYPRILKYILKNVTVIDHNYMTSFIEDITCGMDDLKIYDYFDLFDLFTSIRDKFDKNNLCVLIANAIFSYNKSLGLFRNYEYEDYQNILKLTKVNPDKYMKLALAFQELYKKWIHSIKSNN